MYRFSNSHIDRPFSARNENPKINYLEIKEVKRLAGTPCTVDVLKRASLFACMTGLRISDIPQLNRENIKLSPDGGYCMRIRTQKTKNIDHLATK
ncbi:MAG: hypothetical protein K2M41_07470 [Muribaculaceae bacterium]|nr:hypothetical protein [Muribaculaceae bacterium]